MWWWKFCASWDELRVNLDRWLHYQNYERPHQGTGMGGRRPLELVPYNCIVIL